MENSSKRRTRWTLLGAMPFAFLPLLIGCAGPNLKGPSDSPTVPAQWKEPQSPGAKAFSEKVSAFLPKVETYFKEMPTFTMPSPKQLSE